MKLVKASKKVQGKNNTELLHISNEKINQEVKKMRHVSIQFTKEETQNGQ